jgi:hypothetical protein
VEPDASTTGTALAAADAGSLGAAEATDEHIAAIIRIFEVLPTETVAAPAPVRSSVEAPVSYGGQVVQPKARPPRRVRFADAQAA